MTLDAMLWTDDALCKGMNPDWWFPADEVIESVDGALGVAEDLGLSDGNHALEGKAVCAECPVASDCGVFAVVSGQKFGIWGGIGGSKLKWLRRLYDERGDIDEIESLVQSEVSVLSGGSRSYTPKRPCERCGTTIPGGRWPPDRNSSGTSCTSAVAYAKGARCWAARMSNAMRQNS